MPHCVWLWCWLGQQLLFFLASHRAVAWFQWKGALSGLGVAKSLLLKQDPKDLILSLPYLNLGQKKMYILI